MEDQIELPLGTLAAAEANLRLAEATQAEQQQTYERRQALFARSGGGIPPWPTWTRRAEAPDFW